MQDWGAWLHNLRTKPLPGGVSAAALASAMGAALIAKTLRVSLRRQNMGAEEQAAMQAVLNLAFEQQQAFVRLAQADEQAYRAVLESRAQDDRAKAEAWRNATETPVGVAEACHLLLRQLPGLREHCRPVVKPDLDIGQWLLEVGLRAGLLAAESNLQTPAGHPEVAPLQARIEALKASQWYR